MIVLRDPVERYHSFNRMVHIYEELESTLHVGNLSAFRSAMAACEDAVLATQAGADTGKYRMVKCGDKNLVRSMYGYWLRRWAVVHEAAGERGGVCLACTKTVRRTVWRLTRPVLTVHKHHPLLDETAGPFHLVLNSDLKRSPGEALNRTARWLGIPEYMEEDSVFGDVFQRSGSSYKTSGSEALAQARYNAFFAAGGPGDAALRALFANVDRKTAAVVGNFDLASILRMYSDATEGHIEEVERWYEGVDKGGEGDGIDFSAGATTTVTSAPTNKPPTTSPTAKRRSGGKSGGEKGAGVQEAPSQS